MWYMALMVCATFHAPHCNVKDVIYKDKSNIGLQSKDECFLQMHDWVHSHEAEIAKVATDEKIRYHIDSMCIRG